MSEPKTGNFEGWAIVSKFGHVTHVGFVTMEAYGAAVLFRVDTPALPEREYELTAPEYVMFPDHNTGDGRREQWCPAGTKVKRPASPAETVLVGPGAIYDIRPCTEETARTAIEKIIRRPLILLELPKKEVELLPGESREPENRACSECGFAPEDGHDEMCSRAEPDDDET